MVDGSSYLCTQFYGLLANGLMTLDIGTNMLDGGAPYYRTYETADGKYVAVGAIEGRFYSRLIQGLGLDEKELPEQNDRSRWPELHSLFERIFRSRTRDEWASIFEETDACVSPVLGLDEAGRHPHNRQRGLVVDRQGTAQPAPAPRLSETPAEAGEPAGHRGADTREVLKSLGYPEERIRSLFRGGIVE
jgi:alpha-methylacyl-CoA racemase